jgi:excinuclease ABC subunit A
LREGKFVIVVEPIKDMIERRSRDDIGPHAGKHGGEIISEGTPAEILSDTLTAQW